MKKNISKIAALLVCTQILFGCHSSKPSNAILKATQKNEQNVNDCEKTVIYKFNKVKLLKTQEEKKVSAEIIVNPNEKEITINDETPERGKGSVTFPIESIDCHFTNVLKDGYAFYRTWPKGPNEETKERVFKFEVTDDGMIITFIDEKVETVIIRVDTWELVKQ